MKHNSMKPTRGLEKRRKLPSGVRGEAPAENSFDGFLSMTNGISDNR